MQIALFIFGIKCGSIITIQTHCIYIKIHFIYKNKSNTKQNNIFHEHCKYNTNGNKTGCGYICANFWTTTLLLSSGINVASSKIYHFIRHK